MAEANAAAPTFSLKFVGTFLSNLRYVAWTSIVLALLFLVVYAFVVRGFAIDNRQVWEAFFRWTHVVTGIMWIGHLWYFNFTQIPNVPKIPEEARGPAISKVIAPAALFWFRWGAMGTLITGLLLALTISDSFLASALTLGATAGSSTRHVFIGIGMWLAIIMWFNVWFVIWPNQQKALNIGDAFKDLKPEEKAKAARTAMLFSRTNTFLSAPMLIAMAGAQTLG